MPAPGFSLDLGGAGSRWDLERFEKLRALAQRHTDQLDVLGIKDVEFIQHSVLRLPCGLRLVYR